MKTILKLVVVVLMANAIWRVGSAYVSFYRFKDAVRAAATDQSRSETDLRQKLVDLASTYDVPLTAETVTIRREPLHTVVQGSYTTPIAVLPGYEYQWPFSLDVDAFAVAAPLVP